MSPDKTKYLFETYPKLYQGHKEPLSHNLMGFGFECGDGWFDIIDVLSARLEKHGVKAMQVKEKFGGLRFYIDGVHKDKFDMVYAMIDFAESISVRICENCGSPGRQNQDGWITTLCASCRDPLPQAAPLDTKSPSG